MKNPLKFIALPLLCLFASSPLLPSAAAFSAEKMQESSVRIVTIKVEDGNGGISYGTGSGFIINENGNIVTNQHVVNGAEEVNGVTQIYALRFVGGVTRVYHCKCEPSQQSKELDLAVLSSSIHAVPLVMNDMEPKPLASAYTMGYPGVADTQLGDVKHAFLMAVLKKRGDPALDAEGADISGEMSENKMLQDMVNPSFISAKVRRMANQKLTDEGVSLKVVDCDLNIGHGNSGGPLLDDGGFVIGVVGDSFQKATDFALHDDGNGNKVPVTAGIDSVNWGIAESELVKFLQDRKVSFHRIMFDPSRKGGLSFKQKLFIALACASAMVAAGLAFFLFPRRQPAHLPTPTSVIDEKIQRILAARGGSAPPQPQPKPSVGSIWDFEIQGPGGFRQNVRLTDADFKRGRGRVVLGRNSDFSDVLVKHDSVSRQHLHFELRGNGLAVADRHSSNGTKVNGKSLSGPFRNQSLKEGDRIQFGELTASVRRGF